AAASSTCWSRSRERSPARCSSGSRSTARQSASASRTWSSACRWTTPPLACGGSDAERVGRLHAGLRQEDVGVDELADAAALQGDALEAAAGVRRRAEEVAFRRCAALEDRGRALSPELELDVRGRLDRDDDLPLRGEPEPVDVLRVLAALDRRLDRRSRVVLRGERRLAAARTAVRAHHGYVR